MFYSFNKKSLKVTKLYSEDNTTHLYFNEGMDEISDNHNNKLKVLYGDNAFVNEIQEYKNNELLRYVR